MSIPILYMMIGLPGSGKSTYAGKLAGSHGTVILSSDQLRKELYGSYEDQEHNTELFLELHKRAKAFLRRGVNVVYDATNINYKRRMSFLQELKHIPCKKVCVLMATPYEECFKRNTERERKVSEDVIRKMYMSFNVPYYYEGWDDIRIVYSDGVENEYGYVHDWVKSVMGYDQDNSHHAFTLGEHCMKAFDYLNKLHSKLSIDCWDLRIAALIHDCGKPITATYVNSKGKITNECHYYNHQYTGAYDSLFFGDIKHHLYVAQLIQWHMHPYMAWKQSEKAKERDKKIIGEQLYNDVMLLHEADVAAH